MTTQQAEIIVLSDSVELITPTSTESISGERAFRAEEELEAAGVGAGPTGPASSAAAGGGNSSANSKQKDLKEPLCPDNKAGYGAIHISAPRMYDLDATLSISKDVAGGYLVLLSGGAFTGNAGKSRLLSLRRGKRSKQRKCCDCFRNDAAVDGANSEHISDEEQTSSTANTRIPDDAIQLAFMSLTDGNAIDTVFGVESRGGIKRTKETSRIAYDAAREAKEALREASFSSNAIPRLAVEAYELCFEIVVDYNRKREKLGFGFGFFTQCCKRDIIRGEAEESLEEAFAMLRDAVEAAT